MNASTCPYCGAETRPGDNFCLNCGNRLLPATPSSQQAQPVMGGDSTIPAQEGWAQAYQSSNSAPSSSGATWSADPSAMTLASKDEEPPTIRGDSQATLSSSTVQATMERSARFVLRAENGDVLAEYPLEKPEISIGRAPNSDILLSKDKLTSRRHATVRYENSSYVLYDERSANGTFVNGQQLEEMAPRTLQDGDHVGIGEHELLFQAYEPESSGIDIESMPTITVSPSAIADITYRTREDELLTAASGDDFSTRSMNGGDSTNTSTALPEPVTPSTSNDVAPANVTKVEEPAEPVVPAVSDTSTGVTFSRLTNLPQPALPDVAPLMAALATLDGQVSSLQEHLNATQEAMRNHEADIAQNASQLRAGVRRVSERMDSTIADVARNREQLAWTELIQLMEDVMNNPRDIEYVTKLARKARELNKVFQIHQNVLNTLAECTSLLRSLLGEDK